MVSFLVFFEVQGHFSFYFDNLVHKTNLHFYILKEIHNNHFV